MTQVEKVPIFYRKAVKLWKEKRNVDRTRITSYETEGQRLKAEAERSQTGRPKIGSTRLSRITEAFLKSRDR